MRHSPPGADAERRRPKSARSYDCERNLSCLPLCFPNALEDGAPGECPDPARQRRLTRGRWLPTPPMERRAAHVREGPVHSRAGWGRPLRGTPDGLFRWVPPPLASHVGASAAPAAWGHHCRWTNKVSPPPTSCGAVWARVEPPRARSRSHPSPPAQQLDRFLPPPGAAVWGPVRVAYETRWRAPARAPRRAVRAPGV